MRNAATSGGVLLLCLLASVARADQVEYSFAGAEPAKVTVSGGGLSYSGYRIAPGGQVAVSVKGPGVLRLLFFSDCPKSGCPGDTKVMVTLDGQGRMNDLSPKAQPGMAYSPAPKGRSVPSAAMAVILKIEAGEHPLGVKLPGNADAALVVSLSNALRKGGGDDLDLDFAPVAAKKPRGGDLDLPDLDMDLAPVPARPAKGGKAPPAKGASAGLDLDLDDLAPAPAAAKAPPVKGGKAPPAKNASLDLDLDDFAPPPPVAAANPRKNEPPRVEPKTETLVAQQPRAAPKAPSKPPPTSSVLVAEVEPEKLAPPAKVKKKRRVEIAQEPEPLPGPPPRLGPVEVGARAGWALARGNLRGQGLYVLEVGYRLESAGLPEVRLTFVSGYTMLTGSWSAIEPGRGLGGFQQNTTVVPVEVGATWEPGGLGGVSPYLGLAVSTGYTDTQLQRFSLKPAEVRGTALGATASAGLRLQVGTGSFVVELRHSESVATLASLARLAQPTLSSSAVTGGYLFSF